MNIILFSDDDSAFQVQIIHAVIPKDLSLELPSTPSSQVSEVTAHTFVATQSRQSHLVTHIVQL
jgi:hypothetical protein